MIGECPYRVTALLQTDKDTPILACTALHQANFAQVQAKGWQLWQILLASKDHVTSHKILPVVMQNKSASML